MPKHVSASYRAMVGTRMINRFLENAGLGITGCFEPVFYVIDWKPGEVVDEARARAAGQVLKDAIDSYPGDVDCQSVDLMSLTEEEVPS